MTKGHIAGTYKNCPFPVGVQDHHLIHGSLDPSESTAERHLNWFSYFSTSCRYVQQTDRPLNTGNSRPHLCIPCMRCSLITHTHTRPFNGPFSGTPRVSRYQKDKTNLDFTEARDSEWQWHQLGHMHSLHLSPDRHLHASTPCMRCSLIHTMITWKAVFTIMSKRLTAIVEPFFPTPPLTTTGK